MMLTMKPVPVTVLNVPIPREDILEAIVVVRTKTGVEIAGDLSNLSACMLLAAEGGQKLSAMLLAAGYDEDRARG